MKKLIWIKTALVLAVVAALCGVVWHLRQANPVRDYKTRAARIKSITQMVNLCTTEIHEEIPIKDCINGKWIVARQTVEGRIKFNLDTLNIVERHDTTFIYLPTETIEVLENASPSAYEVLDSWDSTRPILGRTLTTAEENRLKSRWKAKFIKRIYDRGYVKRARANAVETLSPLLEAMQGPFGKQGPVVIVDPTPDGNIILQYNG